MYGNHFFKFIREFVSLLHNVCVTLPSSVHVLLVSLARIVKLISMTALHHRCVTMVSAKMASTTLLVTAMLDLQEGCVMSTLMIVRVG